jgi:hypothetical protein
MIGHVIVRLRAICGLDLRLRDDSAVASRYYQVKQDTCQKIGIGSCATIAYPLRHDKSIQDILFQILVGDHLLVAGFDAYRLHHADA